MDQDTIRIFFALLRSAISGDPIQEKDLRLYKGEALPQLIAISKKHDIVNLLAVGLEKNALLPKENQYAETEIMKAVYRYKQLSYELTNTCNVLEAAEIPFVPLKGSVIREYYPEPWMRTSCDIDILVQQEHLHAAVSHLTEKLHYEKKMQSTHDVSLFSPQGTHIELHFDLVEEDRANNAINILHNVWNNVFPKKGHTYWHEMTDAFYYFYHIAHMAKHFEVGGCGIRPFVDLFILDGIRDTNNNRDELLAQAGLLQFANLSRRLSQYWLTEEGLCDELLLKMQNYILSGGAYGTSENRVALQQQKKGGRFKYLLSRIFAPYSKLKRYYPVLEKHPWLMPVMQVRRWFMVFKPDVAKMAKGEWSSSKELGKGNGNDVTAFLREIGID